MGIHLETAKKELNQMWKEHISGVRLNLLLKHPPEETGFLFGATIDHVSYDEIHDLIVVFVYENQTWKLNYSSDPEEYNVAEMFVSAYGKQYKKQVRVLSNQLNHFQIFLWAEQLETARVKDQFEIKKSTDLGKKVVDIVCEDGGIYYVLEGGSKLRIYV
jgi:hypothetical protein